MKLRYAGGWLLEGIRGGGQLPAEPQAADGSSSPSSRRRPVRHARSDGWDSYYGGVRTRSPMRLSTRATTVDVISAAMKENQNYPA
jgi:hypothetical protein